MRADCNLSSMSFLQFKLIGPLTSHHLLQCWKTFKAVCPVFYGKGHPWGNMVQRLHGVKSLFPFPKEVWLSRISRNGIMLYYWCSCWKLSTFFLLLYGLPGLEHFCWRILLVHLCPSGLLFWVWKKILQLRPVALQFVRYKIGNGNLTNLWLDAWLANSSLATSKSHPLITYSGLGHSAKVSSMKDSWNLPNSNHEVITDFRQSFDYSTSFNPVAQDSSMWESFNIREIKVASIWGSSRKCGLSIDWYKAVWHNCLPPRYSFFLWMGFHKGLRTKDWLINYGMVMDPSCLLCAVTPEF